MSSLRIHWTQELYNITAISGTPQYLLRYESPALIFQPRLKVVWHGVPDVLKWEQFPICQAFNTGLHTQASMQNYF